MNTARGGLCIVSRHGRGLEEARRPPLTMVHPEYSKAAQLFANSISIGTALDLHLNEATIDDFALKNRLIEIFQASTRMLNEPKLTGFHIGMALLEMARVQMLMYADDDPFGHEL